jgi:hypothetical protein
VEIDKQLPIEKPNIRKHNRIYPTVSPPTFPTTRRSQTSLTRIRTILISRFFINLRQIYSKDDDLQSLSEINVRMPTFSISDVVGNLGAPMADDTLASGSTLMEEPIVSSRPMLVGLARSATRIDDLREDDDPIPLLGIRERGHENSDDEDRDGNEEGRRSIGAGPWRQASKSTVDESDRLLVDGEAGDEDEPITPRTSSPVSSMTFGPRTVGYD